MAMAANSEPPTLESLAEGQRQLTTTVAALAETVATLSDAMAAVSALVSEQERIRQTLDALVEGQRSLVEGQAAMQRDIAGLTERVDGLDEKFTGLDEKVDALAAEQAAMRRDIDALAEGQAVMRRDIDALAEGQTAMRRDIVGLTERVDGLDEKFTGMSEKLDGLRDDIGLVKGGHARAEMLRKVSLIADELNYHTVTELPRSTIIALARSALTAGMARNEVESFRNADLILLGQHENGLPGYLAIEVSFTVNASDVRRAMRNASYLQQYTGLESRPVVAGIEFLPEARREADEGAVHVYPIALREVQAQ